MFCEHRGILSQSHKTGDITELDAVGMQGLELIWGISGDAE